jgi:hypothetical protein
MFTHEEVMMTSKQRRQMASDRGVAIWLVLSLVICAGVLAALVILLILHHENADWLFSWWLGLTAAGAVIAIAPAVAYYFVTTWHLPPDA